jgi:hypothetical protein
LLSSFLWQTFFQAVLQQWDALLDVHTCLRSKAWPGLPDGSFSDQKSQSGKKFQGLRLENVDIFYGRLEYFMDIWDILSLFGTLCVHLVHFFRFGYHAPRKIWQPCWLLLCWNPSDASVLMRNWRYNHFHFPDYKITKQTVNNVFPDQTLCSKLALYIGLVTVGNFGHLDNGSPSSWGSESKCRQDSSFRKQQLLIQAFLCDYIYFYTSMYLGVCTWWSIDWPLAVLFKP